MFVNGSDNNILDLKDGEFPFYTEDSTNVPDSNRAKKARETPHGPGSGFDSDTIHGLQAVTAIVAGPNKLVATGADGKLPASIIP